MQWNLERAVATKARRPRGKCIHSSTLLQEILRQSCLHCGTPAVSSANAGAGRSAGLTRGDIVVSGCHVERSGACLCQHGATLADTNHAQGVDSAVSGREISADGRVHRPSLVEGVPGQTHERQLQNVTPLQPHTDVWEDKIDPCTTFEVAQMMWGGHQVAIKKAIGWEVRI
jgi:hypothetical protein